MHIVTGGAGFIGSNLVRALNRHGIDDILVVDAVDPADGLPNLDGTTTADYMDSREFRSALGRGALERQAQVIFHQGACTDTTIDDAEYMLDSNYEYSKDVLEYALTSRIPLVYASSASVYGVNATTSEMPENEAPLNLYARSKLLFDQHVRHVARDAASTVVGLRYFNVYGPGESEKGHMASMVYQLYRQIQESGVARLFGGTDGFGDGEQRRDFVFVDDVVDVNLWFAEGPVRTGVFNVGTGSSRTFNNLARAVINSIGHGEIDYIPFPDSLRGRYQSFTEANVTRLRTAGYRKPFTSLEEGVARYCRRLEAGRTA